MREPTLRLSRNRVWQVKLLYDFLHSYAAVGRVLGVSRERVRQLLTRGATRGWLRDFKPPRSLSNRGRVSMRNLRPEDFLRTFLEAGSLESLRDRLGWSAVDLEKYTRQIGIDLDALRREYDRATPE